MSFTPTLAFLAFRKGERPSLTVAVLTVSPYEQFFRSPHLDVCERDLAVDWSENEHRDGFADFEGIVMPGLACGDNNCGAGGLDRIDRIEPGGLRVSIVFLEKPRNRFFVGNVYRDERTGYRDEQQEHAAESDKSECLL